MVMTIETICPKCEKAYGINTRKDKSIRCKLCGYEGPAMMQEKPIPAENSTQTME